MVSRNKHNIFRRIFLLYYEGFSNMPKYGLQLWAIILLKLFIVFFILKIFFFPDILETRFDNEKERGDYVIEQLTNPNK